MGESNRQMHANQLPCCFPPHFPAQFARFDSGRFLGILLGRVPHPIKAIRYPAVSSRQHGSGKCGRAIHLYLNGTSAVASRSQGGRVPLFCGRRSGPRPRAAPGLSGLLQRQPAGQLGLRDWPKPTIRKPPSTDTPAWQRRVARGGRDDSKAFCELSLGCPTNSRLEGSKRGPWVQGQPQRRL